MEYAEQIEEEMVLDAETQAKIEKAMQDACVMVGIDSESFEWSITVTDLG